jgi:hypothetical protein
MMRVLIKALEKKADKYWYQNSLFFGVGFSISPNGSVSAIEIKDGLIVGPYQPICVEDNFEIMQVDLTGQLSDYSLPQYLGKPYSGIGYEFNENLCDREVFLKNGVTYSEAQWGGNGVMSYFDVPNNKFGEVYEWYSNGTLKGIKISTNTDFFGSFNFTENGELSYLGSCKGLLNNLDVIFNNAKFFPFESVSSLVKFRAAATFVLFGDDINDSFFKYLLESKMLDGTSVLKLNSVNIKNIDLSELETLLELHIENNNALTPAIGESEIIALVEHAKKSNPNIKVIFNGQVIL